MTDRVPGAPGQYKAVVTAQELEKLRASEHFTITITRDDQPITEGTPYSKAAVLPDSLAQKLCPGMEDPTPADALSALHAKAEESADHPGCYFRTVDGETEWLNPPMDEAGKEYRTAKRHKGKVVYAIHIPCTTLPNNTNTFISYAAFPDIYDSASSKSKMTEIVGYKATAGVFAIPARWYEQSAERMIDVIVATWGINVTTNYDASGLSGYFTIEYTKE